MKRITVLLSAAILCLCLTACSKEPEPKQNPQEIQTELSDTEKGVEAMPREGSTYSYSGNEAKKTIQQSIELVGPWHLDGKKNDLAAFSDSLDLFPGFGEWGASMEIRSNGQMSWYIGAEGWHGTYALANGVIHAQLTSDLEQTTQLWNFRIVTENETTMLKMDYENMTIYWSYGDQENVPANRNNESRGDTAYPGADVVEIVNLRGDKTTVYKLADGTYMDRIDRYFTYNGTDTWTDENGAEWNEVAKD